MPKHIPPKFMETGFHCPLCGFKATQIWLKMALFAPDGQRANGNDKVYLCRCGHCLGDSVWHSGRMVYPDSGDAALPHEDMPPDVRADFEEARGIVARSPRGAAALLRLALQKLMPNLGGDGKDINKDIAKLVKNNDLSVEVQQACDTLRVVGNECVHPGTMDLNDTPEVAYALFDLVNMIVDEKISQPKKRAALYSSLPSAKLKAIEERDK